VVVSNGFDRIRRPYSIIGEFGAHISFGNRYGVLGIKRPKKATTSKIEHRGYDSSEAATSQFVLSCFMPRGLGCYTETIYTLLAQSRFDR